MNERQFTETKEVMSLYIDTAKTIIGLSTGALALAVTFRQRILGTTAGVHADPLMLISWVLYLLVIGFGAFYLYLAVKFLDLHSCFPGPTGWFKRWEKSPGNVYAMMLFLFFLASLFFFADAAKEVL